MLHQTVRVLAHPEEVGLLRSLFHLASAVGAFAVHQLSVGEEGFAGSAVPALIVTLVNVALLVQFLENVSNRTLVIIVGGADEMIVGGVHQIPDAADLAGHTVHVFLGLNAGVSGLILDLLTVLIRTGEKMHVVAALPLVAGNSVGHDYLIGVAEMRLGGCVGDGGCDIKLLVVCHFICSSR